MTKNNHTTNPKERLPTKWLSLLRSRAGIVVITSAISLLGVSVLAYQNQQKPAASNAAPQHTQTAQPTEPVKLVEPQQAPTQTEKVPVRSESSSQTTSNYRPFVCTNVPVARKTEYRNDDAMAVGETKILFQGTDGYVISCSSDSSGYTPPTNGMRVDPVNDVVAKGTGLDALRQQQADIAKAARDQQYYLNLTNCISSLTAQGMQRDSAQSHCTSIVRY